MAKSVKKLQEIINGLDEPLRQSFQNVHAGYPEATLERFLNARDGDVSKASKMLIDCLSWRVNNHIDYILELRSLLVLYLYECRNQSCRKKNSMPYAGGRPVFAIGVGNSTYDLASVESYVQSHIQINEYRDRIILPNISNKKVRHVRSCVKIMDMTGLKLSAFSRLKTSIAIATVDDLNYPEKTDTYYIVNAPYVFSACWKAVKPMLQERTKRKVQVLKGNGQDELLQVMDYATLPSFCKTISDSSNNDVFAPNHKFHVELYNYIQNKAVFSGKNFNSLTSEGSLHIQVPTLEEQDPHSETVEVVHAIESVLPSLEAVENASEQNQRGKITTKMAGIQIST
uniref:CRAL-TRIO domain-containing protein n=1 Tax=Physcomitrium patens TaxID=3218 RepID=A0A2K1K447_PHYPA|nr:hypothetical protein PHYPA_013022 [Physcomitrium patens]